MPDVVIIGGGIIGGACAHELASRGFSVTLVERDGLAAGASGRNQGWFVVTPDAACEPMSRRSLAVYLETLEESPVPVAFDRGDLGQVVFAFDEAGVEIVRQRAAEYENVGVRAERLDADGLAREEPALTRDIAEAWLIHHGRRVDPGALTIALALRARELGADIRRHTTVRALTTSGERVTGVATDDGVIAADTVIVAAGPWSERLVRPLGRDLPVTGARGWLVELSAPKGLLHHLVAEEWEEGGGEFPTARSFADDDPPNPDVSVGLHPAADGTIVCGASHHPMLSDEGENSEAPRLITGRAVRTIPALADAPLRSVRSGIRPMSPDDRPMVGWLGDGLFVATGHGSEGIILGGGTASLVGAIIGGDAEMPFDAAPFDPLRFAEARSGNGQA
jgi:glycine/D-amino acid oxidase-like deaminating enzyme